MSLQERIDKRIKDAEFIKMIMKPSFTHVLKGIDPKYGIILEGLVVPRYKPWDQPWDHDYYKKYHTALSHDRLFMIRQYSNMLLNLHDPDETNFVEFGCYEGGVSRMMLDHGWNVTAIDSFVGLVGAGEMDNHSDGDYKIASSLEEVSQYLDGATIIKGIIPEVFNRGDVVHSDLIPKTILLAHIDLDLYAPTKAALNFAYFRLIPGGIIIVDDYGMETCPGVMRAVDEFNLGQFNRCLKIYLPTGQMVIQKPW